MIASTVSPSSPFVAQLQRDLTRQLVSEIELTMRVGIMSAGGMTRIEIIAQLADAGITADELDVKMATRRLQRTAGEWKDTA